MEEKNQLKKGYIQLQKIRTKKFGEIEIDADKVINMPKGLPGFVGYNKYIILDREDISPFCWFQSVEVSDLALVVMNPYLFKEDFKVDFKIAINEMGWEKDIEKELEVYVVINIQEEDKTAETKKAKKKTKQKNIITANLLSPIIVNPKKLEAIQLIEPNPNDNDLYYYPVT